MHRPARGSRCLFSRIEPGRHPSVHFEGERRTNAAHRNTTDPEAKLYGKGSGVGAFLCHSGHALTENRHGLVTRVRVDGRRRWRD